MKALPIGTQEFSKLRSKNLLYVDKTAHILKLITTSDYYFLSRPRRFGKSLLVSTLKEIFLGNKALFEGLYIEDKIEWETHPVIHLDFASADYKDIGLDNAIKARLVTQAKYYDVALEGKDISTQLEELIIKLHQKYEKRVVLLIDEYDKPIIDFLGKDEIHIAEENRGIMKRFYSPIKSLDNHLRFFFLTGVTKFSKVSIFSDLNHLYDITVDENFSTLLGITQQELEYYFDEYINLLANKNKLDREAVLDKLKEMYNGYSWTGEERVYNPFSLLNAFKKNAFHEFWFATGTPTFLTKLMAEEHYYDVDNTIMDLLSLGNFNIHALDPVTVLFQTGYLTLLEQIEDSVFTLGYPNKEVKNAMLKMLMSSFTYQPENFAIPFVVRLKHCLQKADLESVFIALQSLFAKIPYPIFDEHKESYYHSIIFLTFELLGYYTHSEVTTSRGRIDTLVRTEKYIFIFEFKVNDTAANALAQIKARKYYEKYLLEKEQGKGIYLIGVACQDKTITEYVVEEI